MAAVFLVEKKNANILHRKKRGNFRTCFSRQWETLIVPSLNFKTKKQNKTLKRKKKNEKTKPWRKEKKTHQTWKEKFDHVRPCQNMRGRRWQLQQKKAHVNRVFSCDVIAAMLEDKSNTVFHAKLFIVSALQHGRRENPLY